VTLFTKHYHQVLLAPSTWMTLMTGIGRMMKVLMTKKDGGDKFIIKITGMSNLL